MMHQITVAQGIPWGKRTNGGVFHIYLASSLTRGDHQEKKLQKKQLRKTHMTSASSPCCGKGRPPWLPDESRVSVGAF